MRVSEDIRAPMNISADVIIDETVNMFLEKFIESYELYKGRGGLWGFTTVAQSKKQKNTKMRLTLTCANSFEGEDADGSFVVFKAERARGRGKNVLYRLYENKKFVAEFRTTSINYSKKYGAEVKEKLDFLNTFQKSLTFIYFSQFKDYSLVWVGGDEFVGKLRHDYDDLESEIDREGW